MVTGQANNGVTTEGKPVLTLGPIYSQALCHRKKKNPMPQGMGFFIDTSYQDTTNW